MLKIKKLHNMKFKNNNNNKSLLLNLQIFYWQFWGLFMLYSSIDFFKICFSNLRVVNSLLLEDIIFNKICTEMYQNVYPW